MSSSWPNRSVTASADSEGLNCAVGIGPSKFVAKLASKRAKPKVLAPGRPVRPGAGVVVVNRREQLEFLHALPVSAMWGVGPVTRRKLADLGVSTIADVAAMPEGVLEHRLGRAVGTQLSALAHGEDDRAVQPDRPPASIGHEETYTTDLVDVGRLRAELLRLGDATAARLVGHDLECRTIQIKVRDADFATITRSVTLSEPTNSSHTIGRAARGLFSSIGIGRGIRLLGVTASGLVPVGGPRQLSFDDPGRAGWDDTDKAVSEIRRRFGPGAIAPASLVVDGSIDVRRRGDQQWGKPSPRR